MIVSSGFTRKYKKLDRSLRLRSFCVYLTWSISVIVKTMKKIDK